MPVLECVPNISEARRSAVLDAGAAAVSAAGAKLLDVHRDADHNRSVFTMAGPPGVVTAAAHALADVAIANVDLRTQQGVHPRVGAIDVIPFVPIAGLTMDACVAFARRFASDLAARHGLPVFLYEDAAAAPHRRRLEAIRRGGLAGLVARMQEPDWRPDFGPVTPHVSAGVTVVGARVPLIAWNITLATDRLDVAVDVARRIRESSGGLPCVKALGLPLAHRGVVQVSMNLTDHRVTSMRTVFDAVAAGAAQHGVGILDSEIVGLVPAAALSDADARDLRVRDYDGNQILERRLARSE
jgi:glutamate formiminotransferase/glutamate formiminotransferase/formiminotetrahydrofolate cyclodeaminase